MIAMWNKFWDDNCVIRKPDGSPAIIASLTFYVWLIAFISIPAILLGGLVIGGYGVPHDL